MTVPHGAVVPLSGSVAPYPKTDLAAGTPTTGTTANAEEVALAVGSRIEIIRTSGSVWGGNTERALLHLLAGIRAEELFGRAGLTAAARKNPPTCCTFGYARLLAVKLDEPRPRVNPATVALLGKQCSWCLGEIAAEKAAQSDAAGRRTRAARPAASTNALIASAASGARLDGPRSPDGWTVPTRSPTEAEDREFLRDMRRQDTVRRRPR